MKAGALVVALVLLAGGAHAAKYDRAVAVKKVPPKPADDTVGEITCTFYKDMMVRESGTDTPDPNDATVVRGRLPSCDNTHRADDVELKTEGFSLLGRKGPYLFFAATDPNGAVPFKVIDISGRVIFEDGTPIDLGIANIELAGGTLHMHYRRAFNASCSIMQDAAGCWAKLIAEGSIPRDISIAAPSSQACKASYQAEKAPPDDTSIVSYDVDVRIDQQGRADVRPHGAVGCAPLP